MSMIVTCAKCESYHWGYRPCPVCLNAIERGKAFVDAVRLGVGFIRISPDGRHERIDPSTISIKEGSA